MVSLVHGHRWFGFKGFALAAVVAAGLSGVGLWGQDMQGQGQPQQQGPDQQQQDPPDRIARVSFLQGDVSLQPASPNGDAAFAGAELNYTMTAGDRIYVGQGGLGELESDNMALRLGQMSDVTLVTFTQPFVQLGLAQGSIRVRSYTLPQGGAAEVDTVNGAFTITQAGDVRVDCYPGGGTRPDTTIVTVNAGEVQASGNGFSTRVEAGQSLRVDGANPAQAQLVEFLAPDGLDNFDQQRDAQRADAAQEVRDQYVNPGMVGYDDLATYGDWSPSPDYGQVWYPRGVDVGWSPYHNGHWAYIAPWGYTWVEAEPWGFAPFHYGRWANFGGRWGWVPGPSVVRPIYSPALVAFVGGGGIRIGGGGVTAWFPLGPRESFVPWYRASPGYVNRVNVSNIYNRNTVEVRNTYVNRTTNVYGNTNVTYANRDRGTVAVPQQAFASGRSVREAQVKVDPAQMQQAQVTNRPPAVQGGRPPQANLAPARVVPQNQARPSFPVQRGASAPQQQQGGQRYNLQPNGGQQTTSAPATVHPPGGMRPVNPGNNPDLPPSQRTNNPQQQPGRTATGADINQPVGGAAARQPAQSVPARSDSELRTSGRPLAPPVERPNPQPQPRQQTAVPQARPQEAAPQRPQVQQHTTPPPPTRAAPAPQKPAPKAEPK